MGQFLVQFISIGGSIINAIQHGNRKKRIGDELEKYCLQSIYDYYMTLERHTLAYVLKRCISKIDHENRLRPKELKLPIPSLSTMRSVLNGLSKEETYASRYGKDAARHKYRTSIGSSYAERPLSVAEVDHTRFDGFLVLKDTQIVVERPWLTVVVDRKSKCILGFHIGHEPPSHATVAAALKHAILPKVLHESVHGNWPMHGIPDLLVVDNGLEFHGHALKALCAEIGMNISFCPRKKGWAKGTVERVIGTINRNVSEMLPTGRTFHSATARGDYDSEGKASVSLEALREAIEKYIVDVYHQTFHRGINCKPIDQWETYINYEDIRLPVNPAEFDAISGNVDTRKVFHYGVEINNATYNSPELMRYRDSFKGKATIRWNINDLGHIHVMIPDGPRIEVPVHPTKSFLKGMSLYVWKIILSDMRLSRLDINNHVAVANRAEEINILLNEDAKSNKKASQQKIRFDAGAKTIIESKVESHEKAREQQSLESATQPVFVQKMNVFERNQTDI